MADIKPRSSDNIDNIRSCKFPDIVDSSQLKAVQLPDPLLASKVVQLLYTNSGVALLALASDTMHKLWKWQHTEHNPSGKSSASIKPELWQPATGALMTNYTSDTKPAEESSGCIALSKNDSYLLSASGGKVSLFNMITFKIMTTFMPPPPAATCLAFDPHDNNFCAVGMEDSTIQIYSVRVDEVKAKLKGHQKQITGLAFSQTLDILVSAGADAQLCIWDTEGWEKKKARPIQAPPGHPSPLVGETKVQFHNDQTHLLVVHESQIAVYDSQLGCLQSVFKNTPESEHVSSNILRSGYEGNFQPDFLLTENRVRTKDDIPPQALTQKIIKSKCSNTLKSGGRGNFQHDSLLAENMVRTKDDIPPQDPKQNKRKGKPCKLAIGSIENIVAHGMVYERIEHNEAIHTVPLGESNVRVSVEVVIQKDAPLPIPIPDEMFIVGEAVGFFVAWPKNLVLVGDEGASINVECGKYQESIQSFVSLVEHIKYDEAIDIPLEKDIFAVEINIQLQRVDMEYICHVKELSVTCIMLYISHLHQVLKASNWRKQFVFVNPCVVSGKTMAGEKSKSVLLARRLEEAMLGQLVLIPYNIGYHWILLVIDLTLMIVYLLDPINSKINTSLEIVINTALKIYETTQRRRRTNPVWKVVQSPQQPTNVECGFYVMRYMKDLIRDQSILRKQNFNGKKTYTETELDEVRVEWINFVLKNMS